MPVTDASRLHAGASIGGKYRLEVLLAKGGMGSVWRARHVELGVEVAIKFMDGALAAPGTARVRFAREAKAAAALRHPNVVDVRDYGVDGGLPYLVMELLTGEDLSARLKREGRLSLAQTTAIVTQVARALCRAHEAGIVHRDLKPGNIFLARSGGEEVVKLLDFGVAKDTTGRFVLSDLKQSNISLVEIDGEEVVQRLDPGAAKDTAVRPSSEYTQPGMIVGSPRYMSPEQLSAATDLDGRSDLWGLGVIAFRCLTGDVPFPGDMNALIQGILSEPIPRATDVARDLPPAIDAFFARALARNRDARFATADEMAAALSAITMPKAPPEAPPPSNQPILREPSAAEVDGDGRLATLPAESGAVSPPLPRSRRPTEARLTMPLTARRLGSVPSNWRAALDVALSGSASATTAKRAAPAEAKHGDSLPLPYPHPRRNRAAVAGVVAAVAVGGLSIAFLAGIPERGPEGVSASSGSPASMLSTPPDPPAAPSRSEPEPATGSAVASARPSASAAPLLAPAAHRPDESNPSKRPPAKRPRRPSEVF